MKLYYNLAEAVAEALREIFDEGRYADKVIEYVLKKNPKWGARDRRFVAEMVYDIVRWHRLLVACAQTQQYWHLVAAQLTVRHVTLPAWNEFRNFDAVAFKSRWASPPAARSVRESVPDWLDALGERELGSAWPAELAALNQQAKVVLRVNTLKITRAGLQQQLREQESIETEAPENFPDALLLAERQNIFTRQQFKDGLFEVQDAGSQAIAPFLQVQPGMRVIDACAGGGGKTLHLAALMENRGRIIAMDTEAWKLAELKKRARRAGATNIEPREIESAKTIKRLESSADRLLLDVPCSGLGVLKRNPDAKWKLSPAFMETVKVEQQKILTDYTPMLKPGGVVVYSTCSLLPSENEQQVAEFVQNANGQFELEAQQTLLPSQGFDGFYMARLRKR
jgi:16S rRNA (cytosine967-C5)-methyltransferase